MTTAEPLLMASAAKRRMRSPWNRWRPIIISIGLLAREMRDNVPALGEAGQAFDMQASQPGRVSLPRTRRSNPGTRSSPGHNRNWDSTP